MSEESPRTTRLGSRFVWALTVGKLVLHLATANRYGVFRDEMYGLACARHLDWGYISHPPGGIFLTWIASHLFGDSLLGLRLLPALAGAALVLLTGRVTRAIGGGAFAQVLASLVVCLAPVYLIFDHWLTMNAFEPVIWLGCIYSIVRVVNTNDGRYWIIFGVLAGLGLETKYSILFLVIGALVGLAFTPQRRWLASGYLWIGLAICGAIALPNFLWQLKFGFPFLEHLHHVASNHRDVVRGPIDFILDQMLMMEPTSALIWIGGGVWLLIGPSRGRYGVLGWIFIVVLGAFIALKGKNYYVSPVYPAVFAAGAVAFEQLTQLPSRRWTRGAYVGLVIFGGLLFLPMSVPLLSPENFVRYQNRFGLPAPVVSEHQNNGPLPQYFADEFGWEDMVREVARVYHTLSPEEQKRTAIFSNSWGDAAAVDFFGPKYGLPRAICKNDSYWDWGPRDYTGEIMIVLHSDGVGDRKHFDSVTNAGRVQHPYSRRDEWFDIYLCRGPQFNLRELWRTLRVTD